MWDTSDDVVYQPGSILRTLLYLLALILSGFTLAVFGATLWVVSVTDGSEAVWGLASAAVCASFALATWRVARVRLSVGEHGLTIVNVISTRQLPWENIARFEVGWAYWGVSAVLRDGRSVLTNALQKSNVAHVGRRWTHADDVVEELNRILDSVQRERNLPRTDPTAS